MPRGSGVKSAAQTSALGGVSISIVNNAGVDVEPVVSNSNSGRQEVQFVLSAVARDLATGGITKQALR